MDYIAIVDGTGAFRDKVYASDMANSFCAQLGRAPAYRTYYERGPSTDGVRMAGRAERMAAFLKNARASDPEARLFLAGYSRGGSAAIMAAERLAPLNVRVDAMFLFDPVARHIRAGGEIIPGNVAKVFAAYRSLDPKLLVEHESSFATLSKAVANSSVFRTLSPGTALLAQGAGYLAGDWVHPMRPGFGRTGLTCLSPQTEYHSEEFKGSHGALGGVGFKDIEIDKPCQVAVARWMTERLKDVGLRNIRLESYGPTAEWD
jgi:pimeloyl-ACP methyl ester carboxylesterase